MIAVVLALTYVSKLPLIHVPRGRSGGLNVLLMVAPAWVPYAISAAYTSRVVAFSRVRLGGFLIVLFIGAIVQELIGLHILPLAPDIPLWLLGLVGLPAVYVVAAGFLMQTEDPTYD